MTPIKKLDAQLDDAKRKLSEVERARDELVTEQFYRFHFRLNDAGTISVTKDLTGLYERMSIDVSHVDDFCNALMQLAQVEKQREVASGRSKENR